MRIPCHRAALRRLRRLREALPRAGLRLRAQTLRRVLPQPHALRHDDPRRTDARGRNSGRLILLLKQEAAKAAQADGAEIILSDGTPGIGCPVISSLSGAGLVCAVIEAGASGIADFKRLAELARRFRLPIAVIVNKADLSAEATEAAMQAARDAGAEVLGTLPFTPVFTEAMSRGEAVGETPSELDGHFQNFADRLLALVRGGRRSRIIPIKEKAS